MNILASQHLKLQQTKGLNIYRRISDNLMSVFPCPESDVHGADINPYYISLGRIPQGPITRYMLLFEQDFWP